MATEIKEFSFNELNGDMTFEIFSDFKGDRLQLLWQKRQDASGLALYEGKFFDCNFNKNSFKIQININDIIDSKNIDCKSDEIIWDCFITDGIKKVAVSFPTSEPKTFKYHFLKSNSLFKIVPFITAGSKALALYMRPVQLECLINSIDILGEKISGNIELQSNDINTTAFDISICYRKRTYADVFLYTKTIVANANLSTLDFEHNLNTVFDNPTEKFGLWDLYAKVDNGVNQVYFPLTVKDIAFKEKISKINYSEFYEIVPTVNNKNWLTLNLKQLDLKASATIKLNNDNTINIKGKVPYVNLKNFKILSKLRRELGNSFYYHTVFEKPIEVKNQTFEADILFDDLIKIANEKDILDLCIQCEDTNGYKVDLFLSAENKDKIGNTKAAVFVNGSGNYSIWINVDRSPEERVTNIAVLGTCYSRNPFNSTDYFNPKYKKLYKCSYTQFHSNVISLVSNPIEFNEKDFATSGLKASDINFIKTDFEKTFFEQLKLVNPDYLILDFYVDACREVIEYSENAYITLNYMTPQTEFYKKLTGKRIISNRDGDEYFELWEKSLDIFIEKLLSVLPEERIILSRGRLNTKYRDENNKIQEFNNKEIKNNNYSWDRLENSFLNRLPNVRTVDMRKTKYVGFHKHPFGNTYAHFEPDYYKEYVVKLNEIVLKDKK